MNSSDAFWLSVWELGAATGFIIVIVGVVIEGVEHFKKFRRKDHALQLKVEKFGWFLVVVGLAMEFLGDNAAKRISERETARLNKQASEARKEASEAIKEAAQANERAAKFDEDRVLLSKQAEEIRSTNLVLQSKVAELRAKIQPRIITPTQITNFKCLTEKIPKIPIKICIGQEGDDTETYASHLREMFDRAGFQTNSDAGFWGITRNIKGIKQVLTRAVGEEQEAPHILFIVYGTNISKKLDFELPVLESSECGTRPRIIQTEREKQIASELAALAEAHGVISKNPSENEQIIASMMFIFRQMGITFLMRESTFWVKPGEFAILVPVKNF